jgi:MFS family permease
MSLYMMVFLGVAPIGSPIVGWVGEAYGARWAIGIGAIASLLVAAGAAVWVLRRWDLTVRYHIRRPFLEVTYPDAGTER